MIFAEIFVAVMRIKIMENSFRYKNLNKFLNQE